MADERGRQSKSQVRKRLIRLAAEQLAAWRWKFCRSTKGRQCRCRMAAWTSRTLAKDLTAKIAMDATENLPRSHGDTEKSKCCHRFAPDKAQIKTLSRESTRINANN